MKDRHEQHITNWALGKAKYCKEEIARLHVEVSRLNHQLSASRKSASAMATMIDACETVVSEIDRGNLDGPHDLAAALRLQLLSALKQARPAQQTQTKSTGGDR